MKNKNNSYNLLFVNNPNSELTKNFEIRIHPLGPLSMISGQPMDFIKSDVIPTTKMLYGMIENLIGFHFNIEQRKIIIQQLKRFYGNDVFNLLFVQTNNDKKFFPLIQHILRFSLKNNPQDIIDSAEFFNDYSSIMNERLVNGLELKTHFNGSRIYDKENLANYKSNKEFLSSNPGKKLSKSESDRIQKIKNKLTRFYTKPINRQYVILKEDIILTCCCTDELYNLIKESNNINKSLFLGHSESLVEIEVQ